MDVTRRSFSKFLPGCLGGVVAIAHPTDKAKTLPPTHLHYRGRRGATVLEEDVPSIALPDLSFAHGNPNPAWMADIFCARIAELCEGIAKGAPQGFISRPGTVARISGFDPAFSPCWALNATTEDLTTVVRAGAEAVAALLVEDAPNGTQFYLPECAWGAIDQQALAVKSNIPVRYIRYYDLWRNVIVTRFDVYYD